MSKSLKHGLKGTPEYNAWVAMRQRCTNELRHDYKYYGGRGISVCDRWSSVELFINDMGLRPSVNHQLDRIDNDDNYSPYNCRWVLKHPQMQNTRLSKYWFVYGIKFNSLSEASDYVGVTASRIKAWCDGRTDGDYSYPPKLNCWSEKKYIV